jgi:hypothetical protein
MTRRFVPADQQTSTPTSLMNRIKNSPFEKNPGLNMTRGQDEKANDLPLMRLSDLPDDDDDDDDDDGDDDDDDDDGLTAVRVYRVRDPIAGYGRVLV